MPAQNNHHWLPLEIEDIFKLRYDFASYLIHNKCDNKIHKVREVGLHPVPSFSIVTTQLLLYLI